MHDEGCQCRLEEPAEDAEGRDDADGLGYPGAGGLARRKLGSYARAIEEIDGIDLGELLAGELGCCILCEIGTFRVSADQKMRA